MTKLLDLFHQYATEIWMDKIRYCFYGFWILGTEWIEKIPQLWVISKELWFVKWLVENNKLKEPLPQVIKDIDVIGSDTIIGVDLYDTTDSLLITLAIQDNPIEFLESILK